MIETYDPNIRWAQHTYKVTLQVWEYTATLECEMGGNLRGFEVMKAAVESIADDLYENQGDNPLVILKNSAGDTLQCQPDGEDLDDWLMSMVVAVELVKHEEEE